MTTIEMDAGQAAARVVAARRLAATQHKAMLLEMNALFRSGQAPCAPLDGAYGGRLVTTTFGRAADVMTGALTDLYMPWRGKVFHAATAADDNAADGTGGNLFTARSKRLIRPFDAAVRDYSPGLVLAYPFQTRLGPGVIDRDRAVLKIEYDLPANAFGLIRRILDELVEVAPRYYLGKAHLRVRGHWRTVAYFTLQPA